MRLSFAAPLACAAALVISGAAAHADQPASLSALRQLFAAAPLRVDAMPGCEGPLLGVKRMTVGDLLASRLSVFQNGQNRIDGQCDGAGRCQVAIAHMDGEDVSSFTLHFRSVAGKLVPASIRCESTP